MDIYFSPEIINPQSQILNIVDQNQKAVGYLALIFTENKIYAYGYLEEEGVREDFKDLVKPFLQGLSKGKDGVEIYSYLAAGGKKIELNTSK